MSIHDDRDDVATCLQLGAMDFLVKPLRHNELRNLWTRVWMWRKVGQAQPRQEPLQPSIARSSGSCQCVHFISSQARKRHGFPAS